MLIRTLLYTNTLPQSYRKVEEFVNFDVFSVEIAIEKERKKEGKKIFQNKCVSSQKGRIKKRRGRHRSGVTYLLRGETVRAGLVRAEWAAILHGDFTGKTHKIPQMSYLRYETKRRRFLDFQQMKLIRCR